MRNEEKKKIIVGVLFALMLAISFIWLHERSVTRQSSSGFTLYAQFGKVDGVSNGAEVRLGGLQIGKVVNQRFAKGYQILVELSLDKDYQLPVDTSIQIETDGLMGPKHLEIVPGADDEILQEGETIGYTQDVMILNDLLEKVLGYMKEKKGVIDEEKSD